MSTRTTRRRFMQNVATVSGALMAGPYIMGAGAAPSKRINFAHIGTGGRAGSHLHLSNPAQGGTAVCFTEVDTNRYPRARGGTGPAPGFEKAVAYSDYRKMFDKHAKEIDAVVVAVPDNHHFPAAMRAILLGKAVYVEKPLTLCVQEARLLAEAAAKMKVATQMGNDRHANEGPRLAVEYVKSGVLGDIKEIHTWTNRPVWPQGIPRPAGEDPIPKNLDWECWIGPAKMRPYKGNRTYHDFNWRGWFDFGCGAIGDMGCHTWDAPYWSMTPEYPTSLELLAIEGVSNETYPLRAHFKWNYPAKGNRPAFEAHWYDGGLKPPTPEEILNDPTRQAAGPTTRAGAAGATTRAGRGGRGGGGGGGGRGGAGGPGLPQTGALYIGTKGKMVAGGDYSDSVRLIPEAFHQTMTRPPRILERSPGHWQEWVAAIRGEKPLDFPGTNFPGYAGNLTENMLLGGILECIGKVGFKIECDPVARTIKTPEALALSKREYRAGWGV